MAQVFEKMAALAGFATHDFEEFFALSAELDAAEVAAVLGYLLGRLDSLDAAALVSVLRGLHPQRTLALGSDHPTLNMVGTGGGPATFNITTTAAFVVAAAGPVVVKTGSAACRSKSGFADVAASLGTLKVAMPWPEIEAIAGDVGIVFVPPSYYAPQIGTLSQMLAPAAFYNVAAYLNKIGPLLSPVRVDHRFIGANSVCCLEMLAGACADLGDIPTTIVSAADGMDEVSSRARTARVRLTAAGSRADDVIDPQALDIAAPPPEALVGFARTAAAECCERILSGKGTRAQTEIVALNAGVVLTSLGLFSDLAAGVRAATRLIVEGEALRKLHCLRERVWKCVRR